METLASETLLLLIVIAGIAGMVDAIAGGGGLLALPALLWAGLPPVQALATNKLQGTFGTLTASVHYVRKGEIDLAKLDEAVERHAGKLLMTFPNCTLMTTRADTCAETGFQTKSDRQRTPAIFEKESPPVI